MELLGAKSKTTVAQELNQVLLLKTWNQTWPYYRKHGKGPTNQNAVNDSINLGC